MCAYSFGRIFSWIRIQVRIFRIGSGFLADTDPDSEKTFDPDPEKKSGTETLDNVVCMRMFL